MSLAPADIEFRPVSHSLIALRLINVVIFMLGQVTCLLLRTTTYIPDQFYL